MEECKDRPTSDECSEIHRINTNAESGFCYYKVCEALAYVLVYEFVIRVSSCESIYTHNFVICQQSIEQNKSQ